MGFLRWFAFFALPGPRPLLSRAPFFLRLNSLTKTIRLAVTRCSEWRLEKRENLSAPRPQRLLDCVVKATTSFQTSGSLTCNGISSLSFRELDVVLRNFGTVNHSDSARFCAFRGRIARSAVFPFVST